MAYSTSTTITILLPGLPQTTSSTGHSTTIAVIDQHIARSDNIINSYIAQRYDVSSFVSSVPPLLKTLSEDLTSYQSYRSFFSSDNQNFNEWTDKYLEAKEMLKELRDGKQDLVDENGNIIQEIVTSAIDRIESTTEDYQPFFDEDEPIDWKVDADKLTNIEDNR
jgi:hypothetical protein